MAAERARRGELAQTMANHVLGNEQLDEVFSVMNHKGVIHEFGNNRAGSPPCAEGLMLARMLLLHDA